MANKVVPGIVDYSTAEFKINFEFDGITSYACLN